MQLTIESGVLRDALALCYTGRELEITKHALFQVKGKQLTITSTDMSKEAVLRRGCDTAKAGQATVEPGLLRSALYGLEGTVELSLNGGKLIHMKQKNGSAARRYQLASLNPDEFPCFDQHKAEPWKVNCGALKSALDKVFYAAAKDDVRYYLNGVFIGRGYVAATNGYQLACVSLDCGGDEFVIPRDSIQPLQKFIGAHDDCKALLRKTGNHVAAVGFTGGMDEITLRLVDGKFPDFLKMIPKAAEDTTSVKVDRLELLALLQRIIPVCEYRSAERAVHSSVCPAMIKAEGGNLKIIVGNEKTGTVDFIKYDGIWHCDEYGVNLIYLKDALSNIASEQVALEIKDNMSAEEITHYLSLYADVESPFSVVIADAASQIDAFESECSRLEDSLCAAEGRADDAEMRANSAEDLVEKLKESSNKLLNLIEQRRAVYRDIMNAADEMRGLAA